MCPFYIEPESRYTILYKKIMVDFLCDIKYNKCVAKSEVKKMSPRMGRPKADNPKDIKYSIRIDYETEKALQDYCKLHKISKGEAIRRGIQLLLK